jgi:hypothetical protein
MPQGRVNQYERAFRAWPLLTATAAKRSTITYADLSAQLHIHPRPIRFVLGPIQDWCLEEKKRHHTRVAARRSDRSHFRRAVFGDLQFVGKKIKVRGRLRGNECLRGPVWGLWVLVCARVLPGHALYQGQRNRAAIYGKEKVYGSIP